MMKALDSEILEFAVREKNVILTFDLDFGDIMAASGRKLPSIIIFRLKNACPDHVNDKLSRVLKQAKTALQKGAIISVSDKSFRIRHLPIIKK